MSDKLTCALNFLDYRHGQRAHFQTEIPECDNMTVVKENIYLEKYSASVNV